MKSFEDWNIEESAKSDCRRKFERFMFGTYTNTGEPDTEYEAQVFKMLRQWVSKSTRTSRISDRKDFQKMFRELASCTDLYTNILDPRKNGKWAYHGSSLPVKYVEAIAHKAVPVKLKNVWVMKIDNWTYRPTGVIQSWTISRAIADFFANQRVGFSSRMGSESRHPVVYKAKIDDTFVLNPDFMDKMYGEREVIRFENTPIKTTLYLMDLDERVARGKGKPKPLPVKAAKY